MPCVAQVGAYSHRFVLRMQLENQVVLLLGRSPFSQICAVKVMTSDRWDEWHAQAMDKWPLVLVSGEQVLSKFGFVQAALYRLNWPGFKAERLQLLNFNQGRWQRRALRVQAQLHEFGAG